MRALIVTTVLGTGTALVFGAALLVSSLFPNGSVVSSGWAGGWAKGVMVEQAVPVPAPVTITVPAPVPPVVDDTVTPQAVPGDSGGAGAPDVLPGGDPTTPGPGPS